MNSTHAAGGGTAGTGSNQGNGGKLLDSGKIIINITPVNDAPVNTVPAAQSTSEDSNLSITGLSVADVDNTILSTTISLPAASGTLTVKPGSGAVVSFDGTGSVAIFGTAAQINAALNLVTYTPVADYNTGAGTINLTIATSDGVVTTTNTLAITVTPVVDIVANAVTTLEDTPITFNAITDAPGADNFENPGRVVTWRPIL